jgi:hypothetical protein
MKAMSARLVRLYREAPLETVNADWYANARHEAKTMARTHRTTEAVAAGVIAALSPRIHWVRNLAVARLVLARRKVIGIFRANLSKARRILAGAKPLRVLSGLKTRAFYRAIMGDSTAAVVDVWMLRAVNYTNDKLREPEYLRISAAMALAASIIGTTVAHLQAVVWTVVRGKAT